MRILMILIPGDRAMRTVQRLDSFVGPYYAFRDAGAEVVLASPAGGFPWLGPATDERAAPNAALDRFRADHPAREDLTDTLDFGQVYEEDFDAALCLGAPHPPGALALIAAFLRAGKPLAVIPSTPQLVAEGTGGGLVITGDDAAVGRRAAAALLAALKG
jgi:putative intracellular protease/amidase